MNDAGGDRRRRIVHVSDVHFGSPGVAETSETLLRAIGESRPTVVAVSGDLTQRARPEQFRAARAFLDRIGAPFVVVPGNHDVPLAPWVRFHARHARYREYVADDVAPFFTDGVVALAGMDTTRSFAIDGGRARSKGLARLVEKFAGTPRDAFRVVVAHHPFVRHAGRNIGSVVQKARRAIAAFAALHVDAVLTGHRHETVVVSATDAGHAVDRPFLLVQAGTATTHRGRRQERGQNSFVTLDVDASRVVVTRYVLNAARDTFEPEPPRAFARIPTAA